MIRRDALLLGLCLSASAALPAFALDRPLSGEETELLRAISAHNSAIRTMAGYFLQIDMQGNRTEGTFYLERPDKVRFRYNPPSREEIISVGRGFYIIDRGDRTQYAYPQESVPLRQFLTDRIDLLNANLVEVQVAGGYVSVGLIDEAPTGTVEVVLTFDTSTLELVQWSLIEPNGAETTFAVFDVVTNVEIPASYFYIDPTYTARPAD